MRKNKIMWVWRAQDVFDEDRVAIAPDQPSEQLMPKFSCVGVWDQG